MAKHGDGWLSRGVWVAMLEGYGDGWLSNGMGGYVMGMDGYFRGL